ncbi:unnamed protein product, partial [Gongylonema pulchrum]
MSGHCDGVSVLAKNPFRYTRLFFSTLFIMRQKYLTEEEGKRKELLRSKIVRLSTILSGGRDGQVRMWDLSLSKCLATI